MGDNVKVMYSSVKKAMVCFSRKQGWITHTLSAIRAKILSFKSRKTVAGAKNLEDWIVKLKTRFCSYEDCGDWLDGKDGAPDSLDIEGKVKAMSDLYTTMRKEIMTALARFEIPTGQVVTP